MAHKFTGTPTEEAELRRHLDETVRQARERTARYESMRWRLDEERHRRMKEFEESAQREEAQREPNPYALQELWERPDEQRFRARLARLEMIKQTPLPPIYVPQPMPPELREEEPKMTVQQSVDQQLQTKLSERRVEREVARRLALVDSYGEDVYPVGTVITFEKKFPNGPKNTVYTYAVIKGTDSQWFSTSTPHDRGNLHTWDSLVEFLVSGQYPTTSVVIKPEGGTEFPAPATEKVAK